MLQKFYTDTLMSRFIKNFLSKEKVPLLDRIHNGDTIIDTCLYIYGHYIIKCVKTGIMDISESVYVSDRIFPTDEPTDDGVGKFKVICPFMDSYEQKFSYSYKSHVHWYDPDTHKHLGNYLRNLRDHTGLDLMPFYNCYSGYEVDDIALRKPTQEELAGIKSYKDSFAIEKVPVGYRMIAVPIKFNKDYTIAIECPYEFTMRAVIYNESGMVEIPTPIKSLNKYYYSNRLASSYRIVACSHFDHPFVYNVKTTDPELYNRQKDLYLFIQIPKKANSSVVVLEGDYTKLGAIECYEDSVRKYSLYKNLTLLQQNTRESYAFTDRLIEYLLLNVVCEQEEIYGNIKRAQESLAKLDPIYGLYANSDRISKGVWDDKIRNGIMRLLENNENDIFFRDQDGYVNKDIEDLFVRLLAKEVN